MFICLLFCFYFVLLFPKIHFTMDLLNKYLSKRDYSGSEEDIYAQDIETFYNFSLLHNEEGRFLALLKKADKEQKRITYATEQDVLCSDIFVHQLTLV